MPRHRAPLVATTLLLAMASPVVSAGGVTERVSINAAGEPANADSYEPSLSGDGRFVVFSSSATNLVNGDRNGSGDVFVHDRATGDTRLVSRSSTGTQGNGGSGMDPDGPGALSRDGRFVAFTSSATNLVPGDTNGKSDVFVRDLKTGTTVRASVGPGGRQADGDCNSASISATGRFVLFTSRARNLVPYVGPRQENLFVRDLQTGTTTLEGPGPTSGGAAITPDGHFLVFESAAPNVVPGRPSDRFNVYRRDRRSGATTLVSVPPNGGPGFAESSNPFVSDDGTVVAFISVMRLTNRTFGGFGAFVRDLRTGTTTRVLAPDGGPPDGPTLVQGLSGDGRWLLLESFATNLVPGDTNDEPDLFVQDRRTRATTRANVGHSSQQATAPTFDGALSAGGRVVAFTSASANLVRGSVDGRQEILVRTLGGASGAVAGSGAGANVPDR
jgi:Tol biopolymer transport system component